MKNKNNIPLKVTSAVMSVAMMGSSIPIAGVLAESKAESSAENLDTDSNIVTDDKADNKKVTAKSSMALGLDSFTVQSTNYVVDLIAEDANGGTSAAVHLNSTDTMASVIEQFITNLAPGMGGMSSNLTMVKVQKNDYGLFFESPYDDVNLSTVTVDEFYQSVAASQGSTPDDSPTYAFVNTSNNQLFGYFTARTYNGTNHELHMLDLNAGMKAQSHQVVYKDDTVTQSQIVQNTNSTSIYSFSDAMAGLTKPVDTNNPRHVCHGWNLPDVLLADSITTYYSAFLFRDVVLQADWYDSTPNVGTKFYITYVVTDEDGVKRKVTVMSDKVGYTADGEQSTSFLDSILGYAYFDGFYGVGGNQLAPGTVAIEDMTVNVHTIPKRTLVLLDADGNKLKSYEIGISSSKKISDYVSEFTPAGTYLDSDDNVVTLNTITSTLIDGGGTDENGNRAIFLTKQPDAPANYLVTFNTNGGVMAGDNAKTVQSGSAVGTLPTPTRTDYTFAGWYTDASGGTKVDSSTVVTNNMNLYAHWTRNKVTVSFNSNSGVISSGSSSVTVDVGSTVGSVPTAVRDGYTFKEWNTSPDGSGNKVTVNTVVSSNMSVYAIWTAIDGTCTITFDANGEGVTLSETSRKVDKGDLYTNLPTPTRPNYNFVGWYTAASGGTRVTSVMSVTSNVTLYAHWQKVVVKNPVTSLDLKRGEVTAPSEITVDYGEDLRLSYAYAPANADNASFYWTSSNEKVLKPTADDGFAYTGTGTCVLTLHTYDDTISRSITVHVNKVRKPVTTLAFQKPVQSVVADEEYNVDLSIAYGPSYADNAVFKFKSSNPDILSVSEDGETWHYGGKFGTVTVTVQTTDGSISATAKITVNEKKLPSMPEVKVEHKLSANYGDGHITSQVAEHGTVITLPVSPVREGYVFDGWYLMNGTRVTQVTLNADTTVYAKWDAIVPAEDYVVTMNAQNGNPLTNVHYQKGSKLGSLPSVSRDGYTFVGWFTASKGGSQVTGDTVVNDNMTIYAQWSEKPPYYYVLTLNPNAVNGQINGLSGNVVPSMRLLQGGSVLNDIHTYKPTRQGYTFAGWFDAADGGNMVYDVNGFAVDGKYWTSGNYMGNSNMTVYAHWVKNTNTFKLKFDVRGGNLIQDITYDAGTVVNTFPEATRAGYKFLGWFDSATNGNKVTSVTMKEDTRLYAHWEKIPEPAKNAYVAFLTHCKEVELANMTVDIGTELTLPTLHRDGYIFDGWFTEKTGGDRLLSLNVTEDITLHAHWTSTEESKNSEVKTYTVTFDYQDGSTKTVTQNVGTKIATLPTATRAGYDFVGWFDAKDGGKQVTSYSSDKDATFYAHWKKSEPEVKKQFNLMFDSQGGGLISPLVVTEGEKVTSFPTPIREGYDFVGWYTSVTGGKLVSSVIMESDYTLYAHWQKSGTSTTNMYTVTLDGQDGTVSKYSENVGTPFTAFNPLTRDGYTFLGWFDAKDGGNQVTSYSGDKDVTFYAHWQKASSDVTSKKVTDLTLDKTSLTVKYGDPLNLTYSWGPKDATNAEFEWSSSNPDVIAWSNGKFVYKGVGTTDIIISTKDGSISAKCKVTVKDKDGSSTTDTTKTDNTNKETETKSDATQTNSDGQSNEVSNEKSNGEKSDNKQADETVYSYSVTITTPDGQVKKINDLKSNKTIAEVAQALSYDTVVSYTVKTATEDERKIDSDTTVKTIADMAENGDVLLIGLDANGNALGSAKVTKIGENAYSVSMSKDTNVALNSNEESDNSAVSNDAKSDNSKVASEGKSDKEAVSVKTADMSVLPMFGGLSTVMTGLLSTLAIFKKKRR